MNPTGLAWLMEFIATTVSTVTSFSGFLKRILTETFRWGVMATGGGTFSPEAVYLRIAGVGTPYLHSSSPSPVICPQHMGWPLGHKTWAINWNNKCGALS